MNLSAALSATPRQPRRPRWLQAGLLLLFLALTACGLLGGGGEEAAAPESAGVQVVTCNDACRAQGQCGQTQDGRNLVLGRSDRPATKDHDLVLPADTQIAVLESRQQTILPPGGQPSAQFFYLVRAVDTGKAAWVAGWCVSQNPG